MYPIEIQNIDERFFRQAFETVYIYCNKLKDGDTLNAFNHNLNQDGFCPTLTTRPDGFKTAIVVVRKYDS